ncbi:MAG: hypothetical protein AB7D07_07770 [Desulfovibrionaceae bacterium]
MVRIKRLVISSLLFFAGLLVGVLLFLPWENVWNTALNAANKKLDGKVEITWTAIQRAGPLGVTLMGLKVRPQALPASLDINSLRLEFGITPLIKLTCNTGPTLTLDIFRSKAVRLDGALDLNALLNREDTSGVVALTGDAAFPKWGAPPSTGRLEVHSASLALPQGLTAENVAAEAELDGPTLAVRSFKTTGPIPVEAIGTLQLDWSNFKRSSYDFSGSVQFGENVKKFQKAGALDKLPGL